MKSNILYGLSKLQKVFKAHRPEIVLIVTSRRVAKSNQWAMKELGKYATAPLKIVMVPDGERAKDFHELEKLLNQFVSHRLTRTSLVVALGGGSVGDVTGFVASIYMRGISYIQIPTTLLGCVDSSIGGKVAANFGGYKNNIGTTRMPIVTCIDERFLKALPRAQWINGFAEIIKAGLISDTQILRILMHGMKTIQKNSSMLRQLIKRSVAVKESIVSKDPLEEGARRLLNFGHTVGHAVELKNNMSHGMAVLYGMWTELCVQHELGLLHEEALGALENFFTKYHIVFPAPIKIDYEAFAHDKKAEGDILQLPVVERVGHARIIPVSVKKYKSLVKSVAATHPLS